jgi:membrane protein YdbS with pleckstrin-like domain
MPNPRRRLAAVDLQAVNKWLFYGIGLISAAALQVINFAVWNRFWPFFAAVFVQLFAALVQFLRLILLPPHRSVEK